MHSSGSNRGRLGRVTNRRPDIEDDLLAEIEHFQIGLIDGHKEVMRIYALLADLQNLLNQLAIADSHEILYDHLNFLDRVVVCLVFLLENRRSFPSYSQCLVAFLNFVLQLLGQI